jgi:hypothetical protein
MQVAAAVVALRERAALVAREGAAEVVTLLLMPITEQPIQAAVVAVVAILVALAIMVSPVTAVPVLLSFAI